MVKLHQSKLNGLWFIYIFLFEGGGEFSNALKKKKERFQISVIANEQINKT